MTTATQTKSDSTGTNAHGDVLIVPINAIEVAPDFNPRSEFKREPLTGLTESVREHGVLQPLLIEPSGSAGSYVLRDGERRLRAAKAAGLTEVPALARRFNGRALSAALVTALQREGLSPIEEARTLKRLMDDDDTLRTHKQVAERVSKSAAFVSERLRLLRLPEDVQQHIHDDKLPLALVPVLDTITKVSPEVASGCAALVARGKVAPRVFLDQPWQAIRAFEEYRLPGGAPVAVECNQPHQIGRLPIPEDAKDVREWVAEVVKDDRDETIRFGTEAKDAARAYGCLLEYKQDTYWSVAFICDRAFIADLLRQERERREQEAKQAERETAKRAADQAKAGEDGGDSGQTAEEKIKEERREQREQAERNKGLARAANTDLWRRLNEQPRPKSLSVDELRPLVYAALAHDAPKIAARLAYCRPDWHHVEVKQIKATGKDKETVTYPAPSEAAVLLFAWLDEAKTAPELVRRANQALAAATYVDNECEPQTRRVHWSPPNGYSAGHAAMDELPKMLAKLVKGALPKRLADKARKRY